MPTESQAAHLAELQTQLDRAETEVAIRVLESRLGAASQFDRLIEGVDGFAYSDPTRRELTAPGFGDKFWGGRADDYEGGKCWPLYETEADLQELRSIGRWFAAWDETAISVLTNLCNYTIGDGFSTECQPRDKSAEAVRWAAELQAFCDEFDDVNDWVDEGETEAFKSAVQDGEILLRLRDRGREAPRVRYIGGEHITQPGDPWQLEEHYGLPSLCWRYGVATEHGDASSVAGYFVDWYGRSTDWEFVPASEAVFLKRNTPRQAKRGVGDYAVVWRSLDRGAKLFDRTVLGATMQASIAYIKEAAAGTPGDALGATLGALRSAAVGRRPDGYPAAITTERHEGGKVITTTGKYHAGPMGSPNGPAYLDIGQGVSRRVGSRWAMPEYMVSGDASNANYASTMVAESPFVQATKQEQGNHARRSRELRWKSVDMAAAHGRFGGLRAAELKRLVKINIVGPDPVSRDPAQDEAVLDRQQAAGVLSRRTRAQKSGLDYEEEVTNGAAVAVPPAIGGVAPAPGVTESRERLLRFSLLEGTQRDG